MSETVTPTFTQYTATDVQRAAEAICYHTHRNACPPWGQARVLWHHALPAVAVLQTMGPVLARQPMVEAPDYLPDTWNQP
jgi:hypothetical protein